MAMIPEQRMHYFFPMMSAVGAGVAFGIWQASIFAGVFMTLLLWTLIDVVDEAVR